MPERRRSSIAAAPLVLEQLVSAVSLDDVKPQLEEALRESLGADGCLNDLQEVNVQSLAVPAAIAPFAKFDYKLFSSPSATRALRGLLKCQLPGTGDSFESVLSAIAADGHSCFLVGGQVRDVLRGVLSTDVDFNYSCPAHSVALVTVARRWPTKYKAIGDTPEPNYVLIGDESTTAETNSHFSAPLLTTPSA